MGGGVVVSYVFLRMNIIMHACMLYKCLYLKFGAVSFGVVVVGSCSCCFSDLVVSVSAVVVDLH